MELTRKIFYNKRNGQASVTLPSKTLEQLQKELNSTKQLKNISLRILSPKEAADFKKSQR